MDSVKVAQILTYVWLLSPLASTKSVFLDGSVLGQRLQELEKSFPDVSSKELLKASYSVHEGDEDATICWNEVTTLHFFTNGTRRGYVEYSISLQMTPETSLAEQRGEIEQYEIRNKVLDFVTLQDNDEGIIKVNKSAICKSGSAYTNVFTKMEKKAKVEIKLRPRTEELDMDSVVPLGTAARKAVSEEVDSDTETANEEEEIETDVPAPDTEAKNEEEAVESDVEEQDNETLNEEEAAPIVEELDQVPETAATSATSGTELEAEAEVSASPRMAASSEKESQEAEADVAVEENEDDEAVTAGEEIDEEEGAVSTEASPQMEVHFEDAAGVQEEESEAENEEENVEEHVEENVEENEEVNEEEAVAARLLPSSSEISSEKISPEVEASVTPPCSHNKKVLVKLNINLEDDAGQIDNIRKELEIDLNEPHLEIPRGDFEEELSSFIRDYYADALLKHKCDGVSNDRHIQMRLFEDDDEDFDNYQEGFIDDNPGNYYYGSNNPNSYNYPSNNPYPNYYQSPNRQYYAVPRRVEQRKGSSWLGKVKDKFTSGVQKLIGGIGVKK